jgi:hypothetical protein
MLLLQKKWNRLHASQITEGWAQFEGYVGPHSHLHIYAQITQRIGSDLVLGDESEQSGEFNFGPHLSNIIPVSYDDGTELYLLKMVDVMCKPVLQQILIKLQNFELLTAIKYMH